jgi:hypothetical protein
MSISFCIPTARNELEYIKLLLKSIEDNLKYKNHEIIVFVDSDNQGTFEWLKTQKNRFQNLRIFNNDLGYPVGYQFNCNYMVGQATNDVVCLLQSDMVIGKDFDVHVSKNIDDRYFYSAIRIEPSIQPEDPNNKYTMDFGLTPDEFDFDSFNNFCDKKGIDKVTDLMSMPFLFYKKLWKELGGFDTTYRWAKEDWDLRKRIETKGMSFKSIWSCLVYHFSAVSSKGTDWFNGDKDGAIKIMAQRKGDAQETKKFIRKWKTTYDTDVNYRYKSTAVIYSNILSDYRLLSMIEPYFDKIYINDQSLVDDVIYHMRDEHKYQFGWFYGVGYDMDHFNKYSKYVNIQDIKDKFIVTNELKNINHDDILIKFGLNEINKDRLNFIDHFNYNIPNIEDNGNFQYDIFNIEIKNKINNIMDYVKVDNPSLDGLEFEIG